MREILTNINKCEHTLTQCEKDNFTFSQEEVHNLVNVLFDNRIQHKKGILDTRRGVKINEALSRRNDRLNSINSMIFERRESIEENRSRENVKNDNN